MASGVPSKSLLLATIAAGAVGALAGGFAVRSLSTVAKEHEISAPIAPEHSDALLRALTIEIERLSNSIQALESQLAATSSRERAAEAPEVSSGDEREALLIAIGTLAAGMRELTDALRASSFDAAPLRVNPAPPPREAWLSTVRALSDEERDRKHQLWTGSRSSTRTDRPTTFTRLRAVSASNGSTSALAKSISSSGSSMLGS